MIIIDSDCGWDDAFATSLLAASSGDKLKLITSVGGMMDEEKGAQLLQSVSSFIRGSDDVKVVIGGGKAIGEAGKAFLDASDWGKNYREECHKISKEIQGHFASAGVIRGGSEIEAADAMMEEIRAAREGQIVTILALGPLTNLAALVQRAAPSLLTRVHLVVMGGAVRVNGNAEGNAEFNFRRDIGAAREVMHCPHWHKISLIPLDCSCCFNYQPVLEPDLSVLQRAAAACVERWRNSNGSGGSAGSDSGDNTIPTSAKDRCGFVLSLLMPLLGSWSYDAVAAFFILSGAEPFVCERGDIVIDEEGCSVEQETAPGAAPTHRVVEWAASLDRVVYTSYLTELICGQK